MKSFWETIAVTTLIVYGLYLTEATLYLCFAAVPVLYFLYRRSELKSQWKLDSQALRQYLKENARFLNEKKQVMKAGKTPVSLNKYI